MCCISVIILDNFVSWNWQNDVDLVRKIEDVLGKQLEEYKCNENEAIADITKVRSLFSLVIVIAMNYWIAALFMCEVFYYLVSKAVIPSFIMFLVVYVS